MANRVDAAITIGGPVPADRLEELLDAIESERLGPDWEERFAGREDLLAYLADAPEGATLYAREVAGGEVRFPAGPVCWAGAHLRPDLRWATAASGVRPAVSAARATPAMG
jgi:hypothetical protein